MEELDNDLKIKYSENDYAIKIDSFQDINSNTSENNRLKKKTISKSINYLSNKKIIYQDNDNISRNHSFHINVNNNLPINNQDDLSSSHNNSISKSLQNNSNSNSSENNSDRNSLQNNSDKNSSSNKSDSNFLQNNNDRNHSQSNSGSNKFPKRVRLPILESLNNMLNYRRIKEEKKEMNKECLICYEELTKEELENNFVECFHGFCDDCYYNYLKVKINNNEVEKIKCPNKNCNHIIYNNFIEKKLINDIPLLEKYKKLLKRKQLMLNPNIQMCPYPDCESYAEKEINKYVCCKNGHKFCFNCLKDWHKNEKCEIENDKSFEKWRDSYKVKRCPKCKFFIEKTEGCNHMTCFNCKYEWCWLCLQEYKPNHYDFVGKCSGLQNVKCECFSNRFCIFLYQLSIFLLKNIGFAILASFLIILIVYHEINYNY